MSRFSLLSFVPAEENPFSSSFSLKKKKKKKRWQENKSVCSSGMMSCRWMSSAVTNVEQ